MARATVRSSVDHLVSQGLLDVDDSGVLRLPELPVESKHDKNDVALLDLMA
jgi:hypothetical protein